MLKKGYYSRKRRRIMWEGDDIVHHEVFERDNWICHICQTGINKYLGKDAWMRATLDHVLPLSRGGTHTWDNSVAAHWLCNNIKGDRIIGVDVTREEMMAEMLCNVEGCENARYGVRKMCNPHYMRQYRYGDPAYEAPPKYEDLAGKRFGLLTVVRRVGIKWECICDCGASTEARPGDLNRGSVKSCGNIKIHRRAKDISYEAMHSRIRSDRGKASDHKCSCGAPAKHWAYNHSDPNELEGKKGPYSLDVNSYDPMCVSCHKIFDLTRRL